MWMMLTGLALAAEAPPIINGDAAAREDYPMTGAMLMGATLDFGSWGSADMRLLVCSSTLIAPDVVLLAAHCLDETAFTLGFGTMTNMDVRWTREPDLSSWDGSSILDWPEDTVAAWDWVMHPDFSLYEMSLQLGENEDIALLFLEEPVTDVPFAWLASEEEAAALAEGDEVEIVGWGQQSATNWWEAPPEGSYGIKQQGLSFIAELAEYEFKVGELEEDVRKCHGDSGGPSFIRSEGKDWDALRLVGVTSHAYDETDCFSTGGVDTRVDYYWDWIDAELRARCEDGSRSWCEQPGIPSPDYVPEEEPEDSGDLSGDSGSAAEDSGAPSPGGEDSGQGGDSEESGEELSEESEGCGCSSGEPPWRSSFLLWGALMLGLWRRTS